MQNGIKLYKEMQITKQAKLYKHTIKKYIKCKRHKIRHSHTKHVQTEIIFFKIKIDQKEKKCALHGCAVCFLDPCIRVNFMCVLLF